MKKIIASFFFIKKCSFQSGIYEVEAEQMSFKILFEQIEWIIKAAKKSLLLLIFG